MTKKHWLVVLFIFVSIGVWLFIAPVYFVDSDEANAWNDEWPIGAYCYRVNCPMCGGLWICRIEDYENNIICYSQDGNGLGCLQKQ